MKLVLIIIGILSFSQIYSQDYIILKSGEEIESKVLEINESNVKYKRFSNVDGPTYTIDKTNIFMIKYESGDKDVFNSATNNSTASNTTSNNTNTSLSPSQEGPSEFVFNNQIGQVGCNKQRINATKIYGTKASEAFIQQNIVFYGFDFTYSKLTNKGKLNDGPILIEKYFKDFNNILNRELLPVFNIRRWLRKTNMFYGTNIFENYTKMDASQFVVEDNYCFSFEDLQKIIASYALNETNGYGMVVNIENLNKHYEYVSMYITFFDIASREILYSVKVVGKAGGSGWANHYAQGINSGFREVFIDYVYKQRFSSNGQIHPNRLLLD
ncbi:MAG: hypothetical protein JXR60_06430 [Bacteroidales bacterium]|nr:hypothetical protein [Bacteroidales bacterium]